MFEAGEVEEEEGGKRPWGARSPKVGNAQDWFLEASVNCTEQYPYCHYNWLFAAECAVRLGRVAVVHEPAEIYVVHNKGETGGEGQKIDAVVPDLGEVSLKT